MIDALANLAREHFVISVCLMAVIGIANDFIYARYTLAIAERRALTAANWSLLFTVFWFTLTLSVVEKSLPHILAYLIGGFAGTYFGTKISSERG